MSIYLVDLTCRFPQYTARLAQSLKNILGNELEIYVNNVPRAYEHYFSSRNLFCLTKKIFKSDKRDKSFFRRVTKLIDYILNDLILVFKILIKRPNIVHFQYLPLLEFYSKYEVLKLNILKRKRVKVVYTVHNVLPNIGNPKKYYSDYKKIYRIVDKLIVHTTIAKKELMIKFHINEKKIEIIPHGILGDDFKKFEEIEAKCELSLNKNEQYVLFFGGIVPYKGLDFLLEAWDLMPKNGVNLLIVGNGPADYVEKIETKINELDLNDSIIAEFRYVSNDKLSMYLNASDLIIFPYKSITQSGALFLAMGAGKPVIVTKIGGFLETVSDNVNGLMVDFGDAHNLASTIQKSLNNKALMMRIGDNAKELMETKYSWNIIAQTTVQLYNYI